MSSSEAAPPCAGCRHLQQDCVPGCALAPYFPPNDGGRRFADLHNVFGARNVARLLAELDLEAGTAAVESLFHQAVACQHDPDFGRVSYTSILRNVIKHVKGDAAAAHVEFEDHIGHPVAQQQHGTGLAIPDGRVHGRRYMSQQELMRLRQASAAKEKELLRQVVGMQQRLESSPDGRVHGHHLRQRTAGAKSQVQEMGQQMVAMGLPLPHPNQQIAEQYQTIGLEQQRQNRQAALQCAAMGYDGASLGHPQMAHQAQQLAAAEAIAREKKTQDMMIELAAAAAGLATDQYKTMMMMQRQDTAGGQAEHYAGMGLTGDQNMTTMAQQAVARQQHRNYYSDLQQQMAQRELMTMQLQQAAAYANAMMPGSGSGAPTVPFLPGGSADALPFQVHQQPQPPPETVNAQFQDQEEPECESPDDLAAYFSIPYPDPLPPDGR